MEEQRSSDPRTWRGIFTIPPTPFDERGEIDVASLRRAVEFSIEVGSHGIVHPVMVLPSSSSPTPSGWRCSRWWYARWNGAARA